MSERCLECSVEDGHKAWCSNVTIRQVSQAHGGLASHCSLRDFFAGQAIVALLGSDTFLRAASRTGDVDSAIYRHAAASSYEIADAMLAERGK